MSQTSNRRSEHRTLRAGRGRRDSRGSASLELAVLAPGLLLIISVLIFGGRVAISGQSVQQAADQAAREASIARDQPTAKRIALRSAQESLAQQDLDCASLTVTVNTTGFSAPLGQPASVTASVTCAVRAGDLLIPGLPGTRSIKASASSPIDTYRERAGVFTISEGLSRGNSGAALR